MRDVVLGCGHQKSLWSIVTIADEQLRAIHGAPRKMVVRSKYLTVEACRPEYEGEFRSFCQRLLPKLGGGRQVALEFLFNDIKYINDAILAGNTAAIKVGMQQTSSSSFVFEQHLFQLYKQDLISWEIAHEFASESAILDQMHLGTYTIPPLDSMHELRHSR